MFPPAATDISGFGGGRGRERAGVLLKRWQWTMQSTSTTERPAAASLPPSTTQPAYVGGRGQEHGGSSINVASARIGN
jgi:hypothetical protein